MEANFFKLIIAQSEFANKFGFAKSKVEDKLLEAIHPTDPLYDEWLELKEAHTKFNNSLRNRIKVMCKS